MTIFKLIGLFLILLAIADTFFTVLYARSRTGVLSPLICNGGWCYLKWISRMMGRWGRYFLSLAGPFLLIVIAATWSLLLTFGFALIFWPELGFSLEKNPGPTPTDFMTALYYSAFSLTTLGIGDITANTDMTRILTVIEAGLGFSFFTLTITYIVSVYGALQRRNTLASVLDDKTGGTGDACHLVADLGLGAAFSQSDQGLNDLACRTADLLESHKFYPVLHYFHFINNRYALPRIALILMDSAALTRSLLLPHNRHLQPSVTQLENAGQNLLDHLAVSFHSDRNFDDNVPSTEMVAEWRAHFNRTAEDLAGREILVSQDLQEAEDRYIERRRAWHPHIVAFASALGYPLNEILPEANKAVKN